MTPAVVTDPAAAILATLERIEQHLATQSAELLSRESLAAMLSISPRTVDAMLRRGDLPDAVTLGTRVLWRRRDVMAWISAGCPKTKRIKNN